MSTTAPNPVLVDAAPSLIVALQAVQTFINNLGPDPTKWPLTGAGALQVLAGTLELQLPTLVNAEAGAITTALNTQIANKIASLQALQAPPAAAAAAAAA